MFIKYFELASDNSTGELLAIPNIVEHKTIYRIISGREPVSKYRQISLLSRPILSGVMEKCIHNHVSTITNNMIRSAQHGFLKGKSCSTRLTDVYHAIGSYLDS